MNSAPQPTHPLQFFIDVIDNGQLTVLEHDFYFDELGIIDSVNRTEGWIELRQIVNDPDMLRRMYFADSVCAHVNAEIRKFCVELDSYLLQTDKPVRWINVMKNRALSLLANAKLNKEILKFPCIADGVTIAITQLKQSQRAFEGNLPDDVTHAASITRLTWLKPYTTLVTLFRELLHGQDKGNPFISATPEDIKRFLQTCFVRTDGNVIDDGTFERYWRPGPKGTAKIGSRVDLKKLDD